MPNRIADVLAEVRIGEPQTHLNMSVYPLHAKNGHDRTYRTLDDALQSETLQVSEISDDGSVPNLMVHNTGDLPVLMVIGEELIGAKQNRVLNTTILVAAQSQLNIPVSCVEQGRWGYNSRRFSTGNTTGHAKLRKLQTENVTRSLRRDDKRFDAAQGEVWGEVTRKMSSHGTSSGTAALHDVYHQTSNKLGEYIEHFNAPQAEGFLVAINGQVVGAELFDHHETLAELWSKLVRGYALDALEDARQVGDISQDANVVDTQHFITQVQTATTEAYDSVGLGKDIRLSSEAVSGSGLLYEEQVIHTSLFNAKS